MHLTILTRCALLVPVVILARAEPAHPSTISHNSKTLDARSVPVADHTSRSDSEPTSIAGNLEIRKQQERAAGDFAFTPPVGGSENGRRTIAQSSFEARTHDLSARATQPAVESAIERDTWSPPLEQNARDQTTSRDVEKFSLTARDKPPEHPVNDHIAAWVVPPSVGSNEHHRRSARSQEEPHFASRSIIGNVSPPLKHFGLVRPIGTPGDGGEHHRRSSPVEEMNIARRFEFRRTPLRSKNLDIKEYQRRSHAGVSALTARRATTGNVHGPLRLFGIVITGGGWEHHRRQSVDDEESTKTSRRDLDPLPSQNLGHTKQKRAEKPKTRPSWGCCGAAYELYRRLTFSTLIEVSTSTDDSNTHITTTSWTVLAKRSPAPNPGTTEKAEVQPQPTTPASQDPTVDPTTKASQTKPGSKATIPDKSDEKQAQVYGNLKFPLAIWGGGGEVGRR
ncbi:hypothetical protein IE81DRAFT_34599 [Ceraceosorus guamensis]|uniref:Uncharacterized protein n=1 Tax=Ceraceosorus guamensis TaxID=1522189 RepID=A0A316VSW1_9BASI|nr:hypothetical protein IE81DRAFT_34599 [Ceraceosorus guamensis]PWN39301.1 hypothetical protein IE81DRAFT_34599 [Ceraceosorus guamensis]